ncbi:MAG: hypothetical protein Q8O86_14095 [Dehalococcoidia bacterium]|nr:hypothetical protein [Dehalococcoidia bacterium]
MKEKSGWVNVQAKWCPSCRQDYSVDQEKCPRCGEKLVEKTVRVKAEEA